MSGSDFVVAIGTDQHEVPQIWPQQVLQQIKRRRVEPLQVVEEERQWMVRSGKCANEAPTYELKTACACCGGNSGTGGWSPMISVSSGMRSIMSRPFGPSASRSEWRQLANSVSRLLRRGRTRP